jgi:GH25 family lysozyme M1 (1,4-beta-N-acetylmuramidase)
MKPIIDISYWQKPELINYDKLAAEVGGVILRAAYGTRADSAFDRHYTEFTKRGVPVGCYHYICEYVTVADQVKVLLDAVAGKMFKLGYWCDVELEQYADRLTAKTVIDYMTAVEAKLGEWGVYAAKWCWLTIMGDKYARYSSRKLWMAAYVADHTKYTPEGWTKPLLWQYSSKGQLNGYGSNLDMNKFMGTEQEYESWIGVQQMSDILLNVPAFSQRDPRWKDIKLGTSTSTIGGYGCLMTAGSMVARYYGVDTDPARLNQLLIDNGGYVNSQGGSTNANLFVFGVLTDIFPQVKMDWTNFIDCSDIPAPLDKIDSLLLAGYPVIVQVDYNPSDADIDQHWVVIKGKRNGSYIINDPIDGLERTFESKYGDPQRYIFRIVVYKGTPATLPEETPLYRVRVRSGVTSLIIRTAPIVSSTNDTGLRAKYPEEYNVFEEKNTYGRIGAGRWIALAYTEKVGGATPLTLEERVAELEKRVTALEAK